MSYLSPNFFIGSIHIGTIEGASCFNIGNNYPNGFRSYKKQNQGFGSISGDHNDIQGLRSFLNDPGVVDILTQYEADQIPDCIQRHIEKKLEDKSVKKEGADG